MSRGVRVLRWIVASLLALVVGVLVSGSVVARFARAEVLDTDRYVETVAPLASDPQVQAEVINRVTAAIMERIPVAQLTADLANALGLPRSQSIVDLVAPAISNWLTGQVRRIVADLVTSPQFTTVWIEANRTAHQSLKQVLTGSDGGMVGSSGDTIVIDLGPVLTAAKQALVARGFSLAARVPDMSIPYTVAQVEELPRIQQYVRLLDASATWLPILAVLLLGLTVWVAPNRRRGLLLGLLASAALLAAVLLAERYFRGELARQATMRGLSSTVAVDVYDTVTRYLTSALITVLAATLLGCLWVGLAGPSRPSVLLRGAFNQVYDQIGEAIGDWPPAPRIGAFARRWQHWIGVVIAALAVWWLLARPAVATAIWAFILAGVATMLLTVARRLPEHPPALPSTLPEQPAE